MIIDLNNPSAQNGHQNQTDLQLENVPKATVGKWYFKKRCKSIACDFD